MAALDKRRLGTFQVFLACVFFGILLGAFFNPLAIQLRNSLLLLKNLRPDIAQAIQAMEPLLSEAAVGLLIFGLGSYLIVRLVLLAFSRRMLGGLASTLKAKGLLPYTFEAKKSRKSHSDFQEGVFFLLDSYVEQLDRKSVV